MIEQMQTAIGTAERAAAAIRRDADLQARRHLESARQRADELVAERIALIASLTDDLIHQARVVRGHSDEVVQALESAISTFEEKRPDTHATETGGWVVAQDEKTGPPLGAQAQREALIHATRLAVGGSDREAICRALRERFGLQNPGPVADRALGLHRSGGHGV